MISEAILLSYSVISEGMLLSASVTVEVISLSDSVSVEVISLSDSVMVEVVSLIQWWLRWYWFSDGEVTLFVVDDKNLPCVPPISVKVPELYPQVSPQCDTKTQDYGKWAVSLDLEMIYLWYISIQKYMAYFYSHLPGCIQF